MVDRPKSDRLGSKKLAPPKPAPVAEAVKQASHPLAQNTAALARALAVLNGQVDRVAGVKEEGLQVEKISQRLIASKTKLRLGLLLQLPKSMVFCLVAEKFTAPVKWVKLFNSRSSQPFLASAGSHMPASLGQEAHAMVAWFQGVDSGDQECKIQIVFEDRTFLQFKVNSTKFDAKTDPAIFLPFSQATKSVRDLLTEDKNERSEFRSFVKSLVEFESKANNPHQGKLDDIIGGVAEGWVWCPNQPRRRYEVQAWKGDILVGYGMANRYRQDLEDAGKDDGRIKFEIVLSKILFDGHDHQLQFRVVDPNDAPHLQNILKDEVSFKAPNKSRNPLLESVMGYDLDRKVALALSNKVESAAERSHLRYTMPKVSMHLENDETRQARELIAKAMDECGNKALWQIKAAECDLLDRQFENALVWYEQTIEIAKDFVWSQIGLGEVLKHLGEKSKALEAFERAAKLAPQYKPIRERIQRLRLESLLSGDFDQIAPEEISDTVHYLNDAILLDPKNIRLTQILHTLRLRQAQIVMSEAESRLRCAEINNLRHARLLLESTSQRFKKVFANV